MANTTTKKKTSKPKKEEIEEVKEVNDKENETSKALQEAMAMIASLKEEIESLKEQSNTTVAVQPLTKAKKIKCISICHHPVNVFTQPDRKGKIFSFENYGQIVQMKEDELLDVLAYYPKTMADGLIYICDRDIIAENGLEEAYQHIYAKDEMDMIGLLRRECDAEFILNMSDDLRESTIIEVVQNYKKGEKMDSSALALLRDAGYDIVKIADETKI